MAEEACGGSRYIAHASLAACVPRSARMSGIMALATADELPGSAWNIHI